MLRAWMLSFRLVVFALAVACAALAVRASIAPAARRLRQFDEGIAREVVSAVVFGFLQEEIAVNRTTPWVRLLTLEPPADQGLIVQAVLMTRFQKHTTRDMSAHACPAYGQAVAETLQVMQASPLHTFEMPVRYGGNMLRGEVVARATARCYEFVSPGDVLSPLQHEALRAARVLSVLVTSQASALRLPANSTIIPPVT